MAYFKVSFEFADDRKNANTEDFRHELEAFYEQAVLENRMTNVKVSLNHEANEQPPTPAELPKQQPPAAGLRLTKQKVAHWKQSPYRDNPLPRILHDSLTDWLTLHAENERLRGELDEQYVDDGFGNKWGPCPECGHRMTIVRPGSVTCEHCESVRVCNELLEQRAENERLRGRLRALTLNVEGDGSKYLSEAVDDATAQLRSNLAAEHTRREAAEQLAESRKIQGKVAAEVVVELREQLKAAEQRCAELSALLNTPEIEEFDKAVPLEAAHQIQRWGVGHDGGKEPEDWFWLVGYLAGKCLASWRSGDFDKAKHHAITVAAATRNWHAAIRNGWSLMRPGIETPTAATDGTEQALVKGGA